MGINTNLDVFFRLFRSECTTVTQQIDETNSDAPIDVQDELRK